MSKVYFIKNAHGKVKIGTSKNARKRLLALQTANDSRLELVRTVPGGTRVERWFHGKFKDFALGGEWFSFCEEMLTANAPADLIEAENTPRAHIRAWLKANGCSQREMASTIGIRHEQLSRILAGSTPSAPVRKLLAFHTDAAESVEAWGAKP